MAVTFSLIGNDGKFNVTVIVNGNMYQADDTHPNFDAIISRARAGDENVGELFDMVETANKRFTEYSDRISVSGNTLLFDGEEQDNYLAKAIVAFIREDKEFMPLVRFMDKLATNPNVHSREQLYRWLEKWDFLIHDDGDLIAYKSVYRKPNGLFSSASGTAFVNGEKIKGQIPNNVGSIVTMPRTDVVHDPHVGCSTGLHAGSYEYARDFSGDTMLMVKINPRDVVSVPTDCADQKIRVCRYEVLKEVQGKSDVWSYVDNYTELDSADEREYDEWYGRFGP